MDLCEVHWLYASINKSNICILDCQTKVKYMHVELSMYLRWDEKHRKRMMKSGLKDMFFRAYLKTRLI